MPELKDPPLEWDPDDLALFTFVDENRQSWFAHCKSKADKRRFTNTLRLIDILRKTKEIKNERHKELLKNHLVGHVMAAIPVAIMPARQKSEEGVRNLVKAYLERAQRYLDSEESDDGASKQPMKGDPVPAQQDASDTSRSKEKRKSPVYTGDRVSVPPGWRPEGMTSESGVMRPRKASKK